MDKLKMQSPDAMVGNVAKIAALFPQCVTERIGKDGHPELAVDFDKLREELSTDALEPGEERYQFTWPDKKASGHLANTPSTMTLRPCPEESVNFDTTQNLYIEGDNLEVLKILREDYLGKIKMIYIDPPYNTGNDFVYNDDFTQGRDEYEAESGAFDAEGNQMLDPMQRNTEANGRFHTDWLNMIYPRLKVARDLLASNGVIAISIDDNETTNLRKVCDDIFGSDNFVATITVIVKTEGRRYGFFAKTHEHIYIYAKDSQCINLNEIEVEGAEFKYEDGRGGFNLTDLRNQNARAFNSTNRPNLRYPFYVNEASKTLDGLCEVTTVPTTGFKEVWAITVNGHESVWRWGKETAEANRFDLTARISNDGEYRIYQKYRKATQTAKTVWFDKDFISIKGTRELQELLGLGVFDFPKPTALIQQLLNIGTTDEVSLIVDFFSGSATTAHAVMKLNAEDGGHRKFIMVQLPEVTDEKSEARKSGYANICEIGKERIRRAGKKVKEEAGLQGQDLDIGFRVLKLDSSNMEDVYYTPNDLNERDLFNSVDNVKSDRTPLDLLFQVLPELNIEFSARIEEKEIHGKKVFMVNGDQLIATFDKDVNESTITEIAKLRPLYFVMRDASAENDNVLDNFEQIFKHYSPDTIRRIL